MNKHTQISLFSLAALATLTLAPFHAEAKCQKMGFLVNDYGKDGPSKDAQDLLDKHVAKWAEENKISKYTMGKKQVSCELFLNFVVFDEHTCTASANVCWDDPNTGPKTKTSTASQLPEANKKQNATKTTEATSEQVTSTPESNDKITSSESTATKAKLSEPATPTSDALKTVPPNEEGSNKEKVQASPTDETVTGSTGKTSSTEASDETNKKQIDSKTSETCAEKSSTPAPTKVKALEKVKASEPVKAKATPPAPKKTKPDESDANDAIEEASNKDEEETSSSDIETGSLPFFSIGKDNQPEFSRNPLNQNN